MPLNREIMAFSHGVENLLRDELIDQDAASDSQNWYNQDGKLILIPGKVLVGQSGPVGKITGEIFGYKTDGTQVHWRKSGTAIQYADGTTWTDVVTGLTADADYSFTNYSSLAGSFTFAIGIDGIFKMNNASPQSYASLYDPARNFKGLAFIDKGRMILWNAPNDKTGLYGSHIDPQNGTVYTTVTADILGTGDGTKQTFSGTLGGFSVGGHINLFGWNPYAQIATAQTISAINLGSPTQITAVGHGLVVGDYVIFSNIVGTVELNGKIGKVVQVIDADNFTVNIDSTTFTAYSSAGNTARVEFFTDDYLGNVTSNLGGTGTIDYISGAWVLNFAVPPTTIANGIADNYQYENSNNGGVTDFTKSSTRIAGEGFFFPQDKGGDPILSVLIGTDGYYSIKQARAYLLKIGADDLTADNNVYREQLGVESYRGALSTGAGIIFVNTNNPDKPEMTILTPNLAGDSLVPKVLFEEFKFANYKYDDCTFETYERYILVFCKTLNAINNDILLLCDVTAGTVNITKYAGRTAASSNGLLYIGSSIVQSIYQLFSGFDDDGYAIENYWIGKGETFVFQGRGGKVPLKYAAFGQNLKKYRKIRLKGGISKTQSYGVYISYDDAGYQLVGTVLGSGSYVDYASPQTIGSNYIGESQIGGDQLTSVYPYFVEIRLRKMPKFRKRNVKFVALGVGYVHIEYQMDFDLNVYQSKIPARFRQKQNVSLDGTQTNVSLQTGNSLLLHDGGVMLLHDGGTLLLH
jgi:hypothetical protein